MKKINSIYYDKNDENCLIYLNLKNQLMKTDLEIFDFLKNKNYLQESMENPIESALLELDKENKDSLKSYESKLNSSKTNIKAITLFMTYGCNLRCTYCYEGKNNKEYEDISLNEENVLLFIELLKKLPIDDRCTIIFFGGEPLLNFKIIKNIVENIKSDNSLKDKFLYSITTNATLLTPKISKFLQDNNFTITISIDGNKSKTNINRKTIKGHGAYNDIITNLDLLNNFSLIARATITDSNLNLVDNHKHLYELGFKFIVQSESYEKLKSGNYKVLKKEIENYYDYFQECLYEKDYRKCISFKDIVKYLLSIHLSIRQEKHCGAGLSLIAITPDIKLIPCQRFLDEKFANDDIFNIDLTKYDSKYNINYKCEECIAYSICSGGCYHSNLIFNKYNSSNSPFCILSRTRINNAIKVYAKLSESEKEILFGNMF